MPKLTHLIILWSLLTLLLPFNSNAEEAPETYQLQNKFKSGQTIYLDLSTTAKGVVTDNSSEKPAQSPMDYKMGAVSSFLTKSINKDQWANLEIGFHQLVISGSTMGSATMDLAEKLGLNERKINIQVSLTGDVKEQDNPSVKSTPMDNSVKSITRQMPYLKFPANAIPIGHTWHETKQIPLTGASKPVISYSTYTLDKIIERDGEKIAVISKKTIVNQKDIPVDSNSSSQKNVNLVIKFVYKEYSINGQGIINFSIDQGRILSVKDTQKTILSMQGNTNIDKASFEQNTTQEFVQQISASFTETNPSPALANDPSTDAAAK